MTRELEVAIARVTAKGDELELCIKAVRRASLLQKAELADLALEALAAFTRHQRELNRLLARELGGVMQSKRG